MDIGQKVKVKGLIDRIPANLVDKIKQNPVGTITGYKMVDGSGVGFVVEFSGQFSTWFFEEELVAQ
ncbi:MULTISPECIES: DUF2862 domain-containing protein [Roseofilum]|uniref:Cytochrome B6 n=1 Tax=Roseofilum reptotaenium AO1-A TaxID=1925591 RepID=A0A1L9QSU8_9CYAN|nr:MULTISPECIES: DUF2862 domain-containing protein [Roseofilum]OJJ25743.1 cytochrome B6 [Roseofilum reptotaenium AO1-A]HBQ99538.1 cytochrome B6 [Cyanobacteria bacterium UBA11691]MBP0009917.1 DUF2862 domain-containing protein [Roseofilum sp. Belize Diploria]MBP0014271.1 DUF2862 domain-containing protein [Roseofilum sp. SID3]MBP0025372.1 DUF2862 domain-containing protein [Roseofilum sp. SID2]